MKHEFFQKKSLAYDSLVQKVKDKYEESLDEMLVKLINELIPVVNELTSEVERRTLGDETVKLPLLNLDNKVESLVAIRYMNHTLYLSFYVPTVIIAILILANCYYIFLFSHRMVPRNECH